MKVFRQDKQTKDGRKFETFLGVTKSGEFVDMRFTDELKDALQDTVGNAKAFNCLEVRGNRKEVEFETKDGEKGISLRFYVKSCRFEEIPLEDLE